MKNEDLDKKPSASVELYQYFGDKIEAIKQNISNYYEGLKDVELSFDNSGDFFEGFDGFLKHVENDTQELINQFEKKGDKLENLQKKRKRGSQETYLPSNIEYIKRSIDCYDGFINECKGLKEFLEDGVFAPKEFIDNLIQLTAQFSGSYIYPNSLFDINPNTMEESKDQPSLSFAAKEILKKEISEKAKDIHELVKKELDKGSEYAFNSKEMLFLLNDINLISDSLVKKYNNPNSDLDDHHQDLLEISSDLTEYFIEILNGYDAHGSLELLNEDFRGITGKYLEEYEKLYNKKPAASVAR